MEKYEALILEVIDFGGEDVITGSGDTKTPPVQARYYDDEEDE